MNVCVHMWMCVDGCAYVEGCVWMGRVWVSVCACGCVWLAMHVQMGMCVDRCVCVHMGLCTYVCLCTPHVCVCVDMGL